MKISSYALCLLGMAAASQATVVRALEDTVLTPGFNYGGTASLVYDPTFGAGHVAKLKFNLNGKNASAAIAFGFKDWGAYNFDALTSITVYLKADTTRSIQITPKKGEPDTIKLTKDSLYHVLTNGGKDFFNTVTATKTGGKVSMTKANFDVNRGWLISGGVPNDATLKSWLGADSGDTYLNGVDTILSSLKFIQIAVPCRKLTGGVQDSCFNDSGYIEIDSLAINGVKIGGADWSDPITNLTGIRTHFAGASSEFRALVVGQNLEVALPASASRVELIRQDGSKVSSWSVSGSSTRLMLPVGLENGKYIAVCHTPSGTQTNFVTILR